MDLVSAYSMNVGWMIITGIPGASTIRDWLSVGVSRAISVAKSLELLSTVLDMLSAKIAKIAKPATATKNAMITLVEVRRDCLTGLKTGCGFSRSPH